ncbi:beta-lactamase (plasmid) [Gemmatirosa kalamazoonensis]|uniref:Beta-lactamase n=1 Tax=Gemmatirosa kalamazoonensis TaxID=861299 RepID=W0RQN3_9BACT|nr:serine hydrolase domain-containing protein [Gemmatirosa kalamazoonensis]AHG92762.1 beta-lactamase [Gemmatirosa kalamazoonensis]
MKPHRAFVVALALGTQLAAQPTTPLSRGATVERTLGPGGRDEFTLPIAAPALVQGDVDQRGLDVVVTILDSAGRELRQFDGPARGPEKFAFTAERAGTYRIRVAAFRADSGGDYALHLRRVDRLATDAVGKVDQLMSQYDADGPGAAIGVLRGGKLVFEKGYGRASLEFPAPITPRTPFHVASVSKQFTAFAIVLLARDGKLSLDDDVHKYIPELPEYGTTITLRHLLNHTSGIRDQWDLWGMSGGRMDDVITQDDLFRLVTRQHALNFTPGAEYLYSNSGFMLLSKVVERVGGKPFPEFMRERVFEPLGMRDTRVHMDHQEIVPGRAYSYAPGPSGGYQNAVLSYANAGATSLFTTVEDLARWLENLHTGALGGAAAREMLLTRGVRTSGDTLPYALGIAVDSYRGQRRIEHGGADAGFRSYVMFLPDIDAGVVVLSNLGTFDPTGVAQQVADAFLGDAFAAPARPPVRAVAASNTSTPTITIDRARLDALVGEFAAADGLAITVSRDGERLVGQSRGGQRRVLRATSDSTFDVADVGATLTFLRRAAGVDTMRLAQNGSTLLLTRRAPYVASAADIGALAGRYYSPEVDAALDLVADGTTLVVRRRHNPDVTLTVTGRDAFAGAWPIATVRVERDAAGRPAALRVTSGRVRDVRFARQDSTPTTR